MRVGSGAMYLFAPRLCLCDLAQTDAREVRFKCGAMRNPVESGGKELNSESGELRREESCVEIAFISVRNIQDDTVAESHRGVSDAVTSVRLEEVLLPRMRVRHQAWSEFVTHEVERVSDDQTVYLDFERCLRQRRSEHLRLCSQQERSECVDPSCLL